MSSPPMRPDAGFARAVDRHRRGDRAGARAACRDVVGRDPEHGPAHRLLGTIELESADPAGALALLDHALRLMPGDPETQRLRGHALRALRRPAEALAAFEAVPAGDPGSVDAQVGRALALRALGRAAEALDAYTRVLELAPDLVLAHNNRGNLLREAGRLEEARASFERVLALDPANPQAANNCGNVARDLGQPEAALVYYERAIAREPRYAVAHYNRGIVLAELRRPSLALESFGAALALKPDYAEVHNAKGASLADLGRTEEALASYQRALALNPAYADAYHNLGQLLRTLKRHDEAAQCLERAIELAPARDGARALLLHARMQVADWRDWHARVADLVARVASGAVENPFCLLPLVDDPALHRRACESWVRAKVPARDALPALAPRVAGGRLRIGYFSADFHEHATAHLIAGLFEAHDRAGFEIILLSFGPDRADAMRARLVAAADAFVDLGALSDLEAAGVARGLALDIAVDLKGHTQDSRAGLFALRVAPVQVSYLGYPGTLGASYIDYLVADRTVVPATARAAYTERIVALPHCYQVNDAGRVQPPGAVLREAHGLPARGFVYCCFNNTYKITPDVFAVWMRILGAVPGSVLWLLEDHPQGAARLRSEAERRDIDGARLVFAPRLPLAEHYLRHGAADLFLDTLPYNAHTTASDALWTGLPVLTVTGSAFAGRVATSLLRAIGLTESITADLPGYERLAIEIAGDPGRLAGWRATLQRNRTRAPLFDTARFARALESAYRQIHGRCVAGLPPEDLDLTEDPNDGGGPS